MQNCKCSCDSFGFWILDMYWYLDEIKSAKLKMFLWFNLILVFSYVLIFWWNKKVQNCRCSCDSIWFWTYSELGPSKRLLLGLWTTCIFYSVLRQFVGQKYLCFCSELLSRPYLDVTQAVLVKYFACLNDSAFGNAAWRLVLSLQFIFNSIWLFQKRWEINECRGQTPDWDSLGFSRKTI